MIQNIRYFFEKNGYFVATRLAEKLGMRLSYVRMFFIYISFITVGLGFGIYLRLINQDKNEYPKIDALINQTKFKEANEKLKSLNFPFDYPKRNLITQWVENENKRSNEKNIKTIDQ